MLKLQVEAITAVNMKILVCWDRTLNKLHIHINVLEEVDAAIFRVVSILQIM
jgi:hypothetical protein